MKKQDGHHPFIPDIGVIPGVERWYPEQSEGSCSLSWHSPWSFRQPWREDAVGGRGGGGGGGAAVVEEASVAEVEAEAAAAAGCRVAEAVGGCRVEEEEEEVSPVAQR